VDHDLRRLVDRGRADHPGRHHQMAALTERTGMRELLKALRELLRGEQVGAKR
jgi:hypothetical protein